MAAHLLHLGYDVAITSLRNVCIVPWLHTAMAKTTLDPSEGTLPQTNTAGYVEPLLVLDTATSY